MSPVKVLPPLRAILLIFTATTSFINIATAQSYDSDSIYYTPINRTSPPALERSVGVFQDTTQKHDLTSYYFDVSMGVLAGCSDCISGTEFTFATSTTHGITLGRKTRIGAGVGFNTYVGWQSLPLFGSVSYDVLGTKNTHALFVRGQYGWSHVWHHRLPNEMPAKDVQGGVMFGAFIGYRVRYHNLRISISGGFQQQQTTSVYETETWIPSDTGVWIRGTPNRTTVETTMGRGVLNLAFSWK